MKRIQRPWLWGTLGALFALYLALGFFFLPSYLQRLIPEQVGALLNRKATLREVSVNPLLLSIELRDFALDEPDGRAIVGFRRLLVDFELSSLVRWAWTFSAIELDGLSLSADIAPDGSFNFARLADGLPKSETAADARPKPPPRILLQHFVLSDGGITLSDRSGPRPAIASLRPLAIELRDLTTIPDRRGPYTLSARLPGGAQLAWRGEISLQPIFSLGEVSLRNLRPAALWRFFEDDYRLAEPAGMAELTLRYRAVYSDGTPELTVDDIRFAMSDLALTERGAQEPFLTLKTAAINGARFDLARRELHVPSIELRSGLIRADTDARGVLSFQKLAVEPAPGTSRAEPAPAATPRPPSPPWRVHLESVRVGDLALRYRDFSRPAPAGFAVGALDLGFGATLEVAASETQVRVNDIALALSRVSAGEALASDPLISLDTIGLEGGNFDLRNQVIAARRAFLKGGAVKVVRETDGRIRLVDILSGSEHRRDLNEAMAQAHSAGRPWRIGLDSVDLEALKISFADLGFGQPVAYDIDPLTLSLKNVRNEGKAPIRLEASLRVAQGGTLRVSGEAAPAANWSPPRASARVTLDKLSLKPLQPVAASRTTLTLHSGEVSAAFQAQYRTVKERAEVRTSGTASVDDFLLKEAFGGERFLEWKSVAASGIAFDLAPDRLAVGDIRITGLGAKVIVHKDRSTNLAQAMKPASEPKDTPEPVRAKPAPTKEASAFPVSVDRLRLEKAAVDFADLSLVLPFAAKIQDLDGDVLGMSTDPASRAVVKLEGRVDEFGLARVGGSLATYDPKAFLDLGVAFRNVEMPPLSAYSVTFAGRRIAAGRLSLDLQYKIDQGALAGDNKVELQNFTLGEAVETPGALSLPLDLAVALLTDAQGRIAISMPVKGNVDSPEFSYGHLVWQAITTVITSIVSAPFRALFGGGSEGVDSIAFDAGRSSLQPPEREKLKRVASALESRPQLKLLVEGQYTEADRAALRQREVATAVAAKLERPSAETQPVNVRDARTQRALEALFVERSSQEALDQFVAGIEKARGKEVDRVGALAGLTGRASADGAFYDALLARLNETAPLAGDALAGLATARGDAVTEHLEKTLSVPAGRIERKAAAAGDSERAKLALDVAK